MAAVAMQVAECGVLVRSSRRDRPAALHAAVAEDRGGSALVACEAVETRRDTAFWNAFLGRERGFGARVIPDVCRVPPRAAGEPLDHARFDAAVGAELLPRPSSAGKLPAIGIRLVDRGSGRQVQPAALRHAVGPEGIPRLKRLV